MADFYRGVQLPREFFVNVRTRHVNFDQLADWVDFQREKRARKKMIVPVPVPTKTKPGKPELRFSGTCTVCYGDKSVDVRGLGFELLKYLASCPGMIDTPDNIAANVWGSNIDETEAIKQCAVRVNKRLSDGGIPLWIHQENVRFLIDDNDENC